MDTPSPDHLFLAFILHILALEMEAKAFQQIQSARVQTQLCLN